MATTLTLQERMAAIKAGAEKARKAAAARNASCREDMCFLDAIGCVAWGVDRDESTSDGFYGEVSVIKEPVFQESYMTVEGMEA